MSQLISFIALSDREVAANQQRIEQSITDILKEKFKDFDVVTYGSSAHKLFIKDYSDFDFCIRCKKLGMSHEDAMKFIADSLMKHKKEQFDAVQIIDNLKESV